MKLRPHNPRTTVDRGFTLIEIMIVVSIMGIILATGIPAIYRSFNKNALSKAGNDIVEGCSYARTQAILQGIPFAFVIRAGDGSISVQPSPDRAERGSVQNGGRAAGPVRSAPTANFSGRLAEDVAVTFLDVNFVDHMDAPEARVQFYPNGTSDEFTIVIASSEGRRKVTLDIVTALAELQPF